MAVNSEAIWFQDYANFNSGLSVIWIAPTCKAPVKTADLGFRRIFAQSLASAPIVAISGEDTGNSDACHHPFMAGLL